jgi:hypothetical protein
MKPKPYNAKPWEARAFAERRKTLIVRPVKNNIPQFADLHQCAKVEHYEDNEWYFSEEKDTGHDDYIECPYPIGQRYYVRETWQAPEYETWWPLSTMPRDAHIAYACECTEYDPGTRRWRPSTHMPQWAARTHFKVVGVQCKRVREITEEEACDTGCGPGFVAAYGGPHASQCVGYRPMFCRLFAEHHPGVWAANQWCWFMWVEVKDGHRNAN